MSPGLSSLSTRWKEGALAAALAVISVAIAYALPATVSIDLGRSFPAGLLVDGFHDAEGGFRWSRAASRITFRDAGATANARVEIELSGFRPRGDTAPVVSFETASDRRRVEPNRRTAVFSADSRATGWWSADHVVRLRSETFTPGAGDARSLGVRVSQARLLVPAGTRAPLRQLVLAGLLGFIAGGYRRRRGRAGWTGAVVALGIGLGYAVFRSAATTLVPLLAGLTLAGVLARRVLPAAAAFVSDAGREALLRGAKSVQALLGRRGALLALVATLGLTAGYGLAPGVELDLGTGEVEPVATRFGPLDREGAETFRVARAGSTLDLRDFGWGGDWSVTVRAALEEGVARGSLLRAGGEELRAELTSEWQSFELRLPGAPFGFRSGHVLTFPGMGAGTVLRIERVSVARGGSLPPLWPWLAVTGAGLLFAAAFGSTAAATACLAVGIAALVRTPAMAVPFLGTMALIASAAFLAGAGVSGLAEAARRRGIGPELPSAARALALFGFAVALIAMTSPLYRGGHYAFHTNIAEEISRGAFLRYFLPYPGSMLSRQPQWANLVVPHSSLFHTLLAPAAWLPQVMFHAAAKLAIAAMGLSVSLVAALLASRLAGARAAIAAAASAALLPTGFQLLGLGHLMTLFGTFTASAALGFIVLFADRLSERRTLAWSTALLTLCFVSYTGALLFGSLVLIAAGALRLRADRPFAMRLSTATALAWLAAFLLYYIHWTLPFLGDTLPALLAGEASTESLPLLSRAAAQPGKLAYTFGAWWIPIVGLAGLALAGSAGANRRAVVAGWGSILPGFAALDLVFNFLLKHHYFTYPVVALGLGLVLGWVSSRGRAGLVAAILAGLYVAALGLSEAFDVAAGHL